MKTSIQLEKRDGHEGERAYVLLDDDGSIIAVVGPEVSCDISANRCNSALTDIGFDEQEFVVGPVVPVSEETMQMFLRSWGPDSRLGIIRRARKYCKDQGMVLSTEASTERFDRAGDRELAAALWFLWVEGESTGASTNALDESGFSTHEACQIGPFVLYWDEDGRLSCDEYPSAEAAAQRVAQLRWWQSVEYGPGFEYLAMSAIRKTS
jgi:hypothetical protein